MHKSMTRVREEKQPEFKSLPQHIKEISGRSVTGVFSVFGNLDSYNDRIWPGAFLTTFNQRGNKALFLWQHGFSDPPIAKITNLREIGREELPPEVLEAAPDATGGAEVTREYFDTTRGNEILSILKSGAPLQMSFGFDPVRYDFEEDPDAKYEWEKIRNLREIRLWEVSDVLWGANDATVASKATLPLDFLLKQLQLHTKAGARHSAADTKLLNDIHRAAVALGCDECKGILESEDDDAKSRAGLVPLTQLRQRLQLLQLEVRP
jgi:HK97 family phage prohead protease